MHIYLNKVHIRKKNGSKCLKAIQYIYFLESTTTRYCRFNQIVDSDYYSPAIYVVNLAVVVISGMLTSAQLHQCQVHHKVYMCPRLSIKNFTCQCIIYVKLLISIYFLLIISVVSRFVSLVIFISLNYIFDSIVWFHSFQQFLSIVWLLQTRLWRSHQRKRDLLW